ncbi:MAG: hypothetical protein K0R82_2571 [Flavipsychrobacter sp.]|jgi:hypothetical protein|nr:hypothetical protein [Flavipsychrobacter sp.]
MARKQDKNTPSDNRRQKSQNLNVKGNAPNDDMDNIEREAFDSRETGLNESGKPNKARRPGEKGAGKHRRDK